ncbi:MULTISPECIES: glycosyltransferase family 2 protein [Micromonospora]|uniref:glycosyltransferase family 2 protein n=1 Tax=Micromonospora TaxID=1873 RepID=UPI001319F398|nr:MULTISPECIES: glycosyltransferase [Micromonospora]NES15483.1 glycosyltransferase [Micromonospora sp. PPF5-17B]NES39309.1 glycosyltransferase [Micromonospora solifontis]NES55290.1 glycosyltransferase [Micromonospora sp. PPF5-6]
MNDEVHFIAVNYRGSSALPAYLRSLREQDSPSWRMTVVDNSEDRQETRSLIDIAGATPQVKIVRAPRNLGYFGAAHWLTTHEDTVPATWTVVSNMDIRLATPTFVTDLLNLDGGAPVVAPSVTAMPSGRAQNPYLVSRPDQLAMWRRRAMFANPIIGQAVVLAGAAKYHLRNRFTESSRAQRQAIYAPHGSIIPIHRRFFLAGGTLAHPVFLFAEEINIGEQCHRRGLAVRYEPSLKVIHQEHQSTHLLRSWRVLRAQGEAARYGQRLIAGKLPRAGSPLGTPADGHGGGQHDNRGGPMRARSGTG